MPFAEGVSEVLSAMSKEWLSEEELAEPVEEPEEWTPEVGHWLFGVMFGGVVRQFQGLMHRGAAHGVSLSQRALLSTFDRCTVSLESPLPGAYDHVQFDKRI
jgi:hypothetical protein